MEQLDFRAMGCAMRVVVSADGGEAADRLAEVAGWFAEWESDLSRFRPDSELSRLNASAGQPVAVGPALWSVLQVAIDAAAHSDGLVVPTLLTAVERAGYSRSFDALAQNAPDSGGAQSGRADGEAPHGTELRPQRRQTRDWRKIRLDQANHTVTLPPGIRLDLGGIAKGWAADEAARRLAVDGAALVDAGGDIAASGPPVAARDGYDRWPVAVADPFRPDAHLAVLWLGHGGIATSGRDYRRWRRDGQWRHHIIDPRTGEPAATDLLTATVIAPTAREAEIAAKVALILGGRKGLAWIEQRPALAGLLVTEEGEVMTSRRLARHICWPAPVSAYAQS